MSSQIVLLYSTQYENKTNLPLQSAQQYNTLCLETLPICVLLYSYIWPIKAFVFLSSTMFVYWWMWRCYWYQWCWECYTRRVFVCSGKAGLQLVPAMCLHAKVSGSLSIQCRRRAGCLIGMHAPHHHCPSRPTSSASSSWLFLRREHMCLPCSPFFLTQTCSHSSVHATIDTRLCICIGWVKSKNIHIYLSNECWFCAKRGWYLHINICIWMWECS